ncbi:MAG: SOS response-associated peptidase [Pseudomonadota bacterium]
MCGRFFREDVSWREYHDALNFTNEPQADLFAPAYNIAPTQSAPIICLNEDGVREVIRARWGLVPFFWKKPLKEMKFSTFNARSETASTAASFRGPYKSRRCLVPISGFYEWKRIDKKTKIPHAIALRNRRWFCLAGLWDKATVDGEEMISFTILTTTPNDAMAEIHNRMPVILHPDDYERWLDPSGGDITDIFEPFDQQDMYAWQVGSDVGNVRNQGRVLVQSVE